MTNADSLKILSRQLGVDFREPFSVVLDRLSSSGLIAFRLNWGPDAVLCMAFRPEGAKRLNGALDEWLESLEMRA